MPYNVAANMQFARPVSEFQDARDKVLRNALAERQMASAEGAQQFQQQRLTQADQVAATDRRSALDEAAAKKTFAALQYLHQSAKDPAKFQSLSQQILSHPEIGGFLQKHGVTAEDMTPEHVDELIASAGAEVGQGPPDTFEQVNGPRGSVIAKNTRTGDLRQVVGPDNTESPNYGNGGGYRPLTPAQVAAVGLPPGTSAQQGPDGKIDVLSKRDNTGVLSQKDATTAKMKLNTVKLARAQLMKVKEAFDEGRKGINAFGPGQGILPTQAGKKFDGRVDQMRSTLTALTRVPGVGSMSDYETKLDQAKFPSRGAFESVTADKIQGLDDMLSLIENGYTDLLSGGAQPATPAAKAPTVSNW